jgi:hypothetical protein
MKRFNYSDYATGAVIATLTLAVVAITDASAGATYLIAVGFLALAIAVRLGPERVQLWREEHEKAPSTKS